MRVTSTYWSDTVISVSWQWNNLNNLRNSISIQTLYYPLFLHQYQWNGRQTKEFGLYFMSYSFFFCFFVCLIFFLSFCFCFLGFFFVCLHGVLRLTRDLSPFTHLETSYFVFISKFLLICISYSYKNFIDLIFYVCAF